jgi:hypothetical protein
MTRNRITRQPSNTTPEDLTKARRSFTPATYQADALVVVTITEIRTRAGPEPGQLTELNVWIVLVQRRPVPRCQFECAEHIGIGVERLSEKRSDLVGSFGADDDRYTYR